MSAKDDRERGIQSCLGKLANEVVAYFFRLPQVRIEAIWAGGLQPEMTKDHPGVDEGGMA